MLEKRTGRKVWSAMSFQVLMRTQRSTGGDMGRIRQAFLPNKLAKFSKANSCRQQRHSERLGVHPSSVERQIGFQRRVPLGKQRPPVFWRSTGPSRTRCGSRSARRFGSRSQSIHTCKSLPRPHGSCERAEGVFLSFSHVSHAKQGSAFKDSCVARYCF